MKGSKSPIGSTRTAPNGYHYTKTAKGWELTHRLVAEQKLGRKLLPTERIKFKDNNRNNYADPDNLIVYTVKTSSTERRRAQLLARREAIDAELAELETVSG